MRIFHFAAIAAAGIALAVSSSPQAQSADNAGKRDKVYGYVDLTTGMFHATKQAEPEPDTTASTLKTYTGTVDVTIVSTITSTLPSGTTILCDVTLLGEVDGVITNEIASAPATISGEKATCAVKVPYSMTGVAGGSATSYFFTGNYKVTASKVSATSQPITDFNVIRQVTAPLTTATGSQDFPLPANGTVTSLTYDTAL
jgi:hypothetical protein